MRITLSHNRITVSQGVDVATVELQYAKDGSIMAGNLESTGSQLCLKTLMSIAFKRQMYFVVNDDDPHRAGLERLYRIFGAIYTGKVFRTIA